MTPKVIDTVDVPVKLAGNLTVGEDYVVSIFGDWNDCTGTLSKAVVTGGTAYPIEDGSELTANVDRVWTATGAELWFTATGTTPDLQGFVQRQVERTVG